MNTSLQLEIGLSPAHRNRYLFSDHYLNHILPEDPRWDEALSDAVDFLMWLKDLYAKEQGQLPEYNEGSLEAHWFRPILRALGHVFESQPTVPGLNVFAKRPDYVFFPDEPTRREAAHLQNEDEYAEKALAVGEVKRWDTPLGKKRRGGGPSFEDRNPSWQIDYYLRTTNLDWGILTNGGLWRLVHRDTSHRLQIYYEVDLVQLLREADAERMRYFALFFCQAAFQPDPRGRVFLDDALAASNQYAVELEEDLEDNVYRALERLMQGFLDLPANNLGANDLRDVYENSLYLLYRLLFILYGESRGLLPLHNEHYLASYSLTSIKEEIAELGYALPPRGRKYWGYLQNLFHIINGDDAELNRSLGVPRYNGGLFDPEQHPFLEEKAVGDRALVEAIDLVSRRETEAGREFADYRTLGVRHLGSIYEGLLEYQPRVADEPVVAIRDGGDERWVIASEAAEDARVIEGRAAGEVYLETDRGERKATGSYYTPQYIVEYIVDQTLGPLAEEAVERVKGRATGAKTKAARADAEQSLVDEILDLKVLDPAMGSGHFLVEATEFLALALATDPYVETAETAEEDLTYWKRRVVERCIYGVDKNPLAVELAKLSLWLATVAADRPLSFLDHHLKCGDSLIGARVEDLGWAPPPVLSKRAQQQVAQQKAGQINMFEHVLSKMLPTVMGRILEITEEESRDYATVRAKEAADQAVRELKAPFVAVADLWTSAYFGNAFEQGDYDEALGVISRPETLLGLEPVAQAREMAEERRFFHWELAFPEGFYDEHGQRLGERAGFDAMVGNPPWVTLRGKQKMGVSKQLVEYYLSAFVHSAEYKVNTFALFMEQALHLLEREGRLGQIIPNTVLTNYYLWKIRSYLLENTRITSILDLGRDVFGEGVADSVILIARKATSVETNHRIEILTGLETFRAGGHEFERLPQHLFLEEERCVIDVHSTTKDFEILKRVESSSVRLGEIAENYVGIITGDNSRFIAREKKDHRWKPILIGSDILPYRYRFRSRYVLFDREQLWSNTDESVYLRPQKILLRKTGNTLIACYDDKKCFTEQSVYNIYLRNEDPRVALRYLVSLLNSALLRYYFSKRLITNPEAYPYIKGIHIDMLPVHRIDFTTPAAERARLVTEGIAKSAVWIERAEKGSVRCGSFSAFIGSDLGRWLDARLSTEPEQSDVVHDLLAHLAERMIAMHEKKQERVEAFWLDLEGVTDAETYEDLKEHGKWESSLWKAEACRPFVDEESRSTRHLDKSLGWGEGCFKAFVKMLAGRVANLSEVVEVYRKHAGAYGVLVLRIEATDRLIDLVVYRLYGLTEEDVEVVAGPQN